jgi:hypothetical protein
MKTQYFTATSLDGFIATEDDSLDWLFPLGDLSQSSYPEFIAQVGALAMRPDWFGHPREGEATVPSSSVEPDPALNVGSRQLGAGMAELRYDVCKGGVGNAA